MRIASTARRRIIAAIGGSLVTALLAALYLTPYVVASRLRHAAAAGDTESMSSYVDFDAFRESVKGQALLHRTMDHMRGLPAPQGNDRPMPSVASTQIERWAAKISEVFSMPQAIAALATGGDPMIVLLPRGVQPPKGPKQSDIKVSTGYEDFGTFVLRIGMPDGVTRGLVFTRRGLSWKLSGFRAAT